MRRCTSSCTIRACTASAYGKRSSPSAPPSLPKERVYASELAMDEWSRAACDVPRELPLPNMTHARSEH
mgnify:CR=1 FL=1